MNAAEAWALVLQEIRRCGWPREKEAMANLADKDLRISALVRSIGWQRLCMSSNHQLGIEREWFCMNFERGIA